MYCWWKSSTSNLIPPSKKYWLSKFKKNILKFFKYFYFLDFSLFFFLLLNCYFALLFLWFQKHFATPASQCFAYLSPLTSFTVTRSVIFKFFCLSSHLPPLSDHFYVLIKKKKLSAKISAFPSSFEIKKKSTTWQLFLHYFKIKISFLGIII